MIDLVKGFVVCVCASFNFFSLVSSLVTQTCFSGQESGIVSIVYFVVALRSC